VEWNLEFANGPLILTFARAQEKITGGARGQLI
jgi:hypothetical protein